jgi:hypothetical protein
LIQLFGKNKLGGEKIDLPIDAIAGKKAKYKHPIGVSENPEYSIDYVLTDMKDLRTSHDPTKNFAQREDYPAQIQDRDYEKDSEKSKVYDIAAQLDPDFMISDAISAQEGAPIITKDGIVLSGNGRTMGLIYAKGHFPNAYEKYKDALKKNIIKFGFLPEDIDKYENPVLVRVVDIESKSKEAIDFGISANSKLSASRSEIREAASFARNMPDELFTELRNVDESTMSDILNKKNFIDFIKKNIPVKEQKSFINETTNKLSDSGKALVKRIMLLKAFDKPEVLEGMSPAQYRMYENVIPTLIDIKIKQRNNEISQKHYDILGTVKETIEYYNDKIVSKGYENYEHYKKQKEFYEKKEKPKNEIEKMINKFEKITGSVQLRTYLQNLTKLAAQESAYTSGMLQIKHRDFVDLISEAGIKPEKKEIKKKEEAMFKEKQKTIKLTEIEKENILKELCKTIKTENQLKEKIAEILKQRQATMKESQTNVANFALPTSAGIAGIKKKEKLEGGTPPIVKSQKLKISGTPPIAKKQNLKITKGQGMSKTQKTISKGEYGAVHPEPEWDKPKKPFSKLSPVGKMKARLFSRRDETAMAGKAEGAIKKAQKLKIKHKPAQKAEEFLTKQARKGKYKPEQPSAKMQEMKAVLFGELFDSKDGVPKDKAAVKITRGKNAGKYFGRSKKPSQQPQLQAQPQPKAASQTLTTKGTKKLKSPDPKTQSTSTKISKKVKKLTGKEMLNLERINLITLQENTIKNINKITKLTEIEKEDLERKIIEANTAKGVLKKMWSLPLLIIPAVTGLGALAWLGATAVIGPVAIAKSIKAKKARKKLGSTEYKLEREQENLHDLKEKIERAELGYKAYLEKEQERKEKRARKKRERNERLSKPRPANLQEKKSAISAKEIILHTIKQKMNYQEAKEYAKKIVNEYEKVEQLTDEDMLEILSKIVANSDIQPDADKEKRNNVD